MKTVAMSNEAHAVIKKWWKDMKLSSEEFFDEWVKAVKNKKRAVFYAALCMPSEFRKPLSGVRIAKNYKK